MVLLNIYQRTFLLFSVSIWCVQKNSVKKIVKMCKMWRKIRKIEIFLKFLWKIITKEAMPVFMHHNIIFWRWWIARYWQCQPSQAGCVSIASCCKMRSGRWTKLLLWVQQSAIDSGCATAQWSRWRNRRGGWEKRCRLGFVLIASSKNRTNIYLVYCENYKTLHTHFLVK